MNRFIFAPGLFLLAAAAWAQPPAKGVCFSSMLMEPWIQVDAQTAIVNTRKQSYLVTVPDCDSFFAGFTGELYGDNGPRVCAGTQIRYTNAGQYVETCVITDIVRYQVNALEAVEGSELED